MSLLLLNLFHAKYCLLHTFTQHFLSAAQSVAFRFVELFWSQVSYLREMLHISFVFRMLGKRWNLLINKWGFFSHIFPLTWNTSFTYCILLNCVVLWFIELDSLIFTEIFFIMSNFFFCSALSFSYWVVFYSINLKKKLWNKSDGICSRAPIVPFASRWQHVAAQLVGLRAKCPQRN